MISKDQGCVLESSVLVLNRFYAATRVITVRRAFTLLYCAAAEVIQREDGQYAAYDFPSWRLLSHLHTVGLGDPHCDAREPNHAASLERASHDQASHARASQARAAPDWEPGDWVQTVSGVLLAPRVVRLLHYDGQHRHTLRFSRRNLFARDDHRCQYCGNRFAPEQLSFDHVIPRSRGGETNWENVVCSCLTCNSRKGGRTPQEARMRLIRRPARPKTNPLLTQKLSHPRYDVWRAFLPESGHGVGGTS